MTQDGGTQDTRWRAAWRLETASRRRNWWQYWQTLMINSPGQLKSAGVIFVNRYHHTHTHTHTHGKDGIKFFTGELEGHARVTRLETAKNSVDARCMRSHTSACRRAPARPCRCPTTHVPLARRSHTHTQCPPMSMPHHPRASRRAPPPVSHTQCLPAPIHNCFSPHAPARAKPAS